MCIRDRLVVVLVLTLIPSSLTDSLKSKKPFFLTPQPLQRNILFQSQTKWKSVAWISLYVTRLLRNTKKDRQQCLGAFHPHTTRRTETNFLPLYCHYWHLVTVQNLKQKENWIYQVHIHEVSHKIPKRSLNKGLLQVFLWVGQWYSAILLY